MLLPKESVGIFAGCGFDWLAQAAIALGWTETATNCTAISRMTFGMAATVQFENPGLKHKRIRTALALSHLFFSDPKIKAAALVGLAVIEVDFAKVYESAKGRIFAG